MEDAYENFLAAVWAIENGESREARLHLARVHRSLAALSARSVRASTQRLASKLRRGEHDVWPLVWEVSDELADLRKLLFGARDG